MTKRSDQKTKLFFVHLDTNECTEGKHDCDENAECNNNLVEQTPARDSKIAGCSASEHYSKTFGVLIVLFVSSFI